MAATIAVCAYLYLRLDDEIRRYSEQMLASHYTNLRVQVGSARFVQGRGITIYDVALSDPNAVEAHRSLMHIDELQLLGQLDTRDILSRDPEIERIVVKRPQLFARRGNDGAWNLNRLLPLPKFGDRSPHVQMEGAVLVISDEQKPQDLPLVVRDIDLQVHRGAKALGEAPTWQFFGSVARPLAEKVAFSGDYDAATGQLDVAGTVVQLEMTPEFLDSLPLDGLESIRGAEMHGRVDFTFEAHRAAGAGAPLQWAVKDFKLTGGQFSHPRLPRRISEVQAQGTCDQNGLDLTSCTGKYGQTDVILACRRTGWHAAAPLALRARAVNLQLDQQLETSIPSSLWKWWNRFRPTGNVTASLSLTFDERGWLPDATVECHQVSFADTEKFPYRLQNATGTLRYFDTGGLQGAELTFALQPTMQGRQVNISGHFVGMPDLDSMSAAGPLPTGELQIIGTKVASHQELIDALPATARGVVNSLNPSGEFSFVWKAERTSPQQPLMATSLTLDLLDSRFRYVHFPYPLSHVSGRVIANGKHWTFQDLIARDQGSGQVVQGNGSLTPTPSGALLQLTIGGTEVPLDNDLRGALDPALQELWSQLRPQGRINFSTQVTHETGGQQKPRVEIVIEDHERSVLMEPTFFPFRLEQIGGRVAVSADKRVTLENVRARHGQMEIITQGGWQPLVSGGWEFRLQGLHVDRLTPSHDLIAAVPSTVRKVFEQLQPEGYFEIQGGDLIFTQPSSQDPRIDTRWDMILDCHQADLNAGVPLHGVSGSVRLIGGNVGGQCSTVGELQIDSLMWRGVQFTGIRGPMWCDHSQCLFGQGATQKMDQPSRSMVAQICGGAVAMNGNVMYDGYPRYGLKAELRGLDLARFANEQLNGQGDLSGRVDGELRLQGHGSSLYGLEGAGRLTVNDAHLYELPLLVSLLKVLRNRAPDTTAFNKVESEFLIQGDRIDLEHLDLLGDAVSFYGSGDAWFNKRVDLAFYSIVGQNELSLPLLRSFVGQASEQFLQLTVDGTIDDPQTHAKAFPGVTNMLEQLQTDLQGPAMPSAAQHPTLPAPR